MGFKFIEELSVSANPTNGAWVDNHFGDLTAIAVDITDLSSAAIVVQQEFTDDDGNTSVLDVWTSPTLTGDEVLYPSLDTEDSDGAAGARVLVPLLSGARYRLKIIGATSGSLKYWIGVR